MPGRVTFDTFNRIAQLGGTIKKIKEEGEVKTYGRGSWGKVVKWLRQTFRPGRFQGDNRKVMKSFVAALNERFRDIGELEIKSIVFGSLDLQGARPLAAMQIRRVTGDLKALRRARVERHAREMARGLCSYGRLEQLDTRALEDRIVSRALEKIDDGELFVSSDQINQIIKREADLFLEAHQLSGGDPEKLAGMLAILDGKKEIKTVHGLRTAFAGSEDVRELVDYLRDGDNEPGSIEFSPGLIGRLALLVDRFDEKLRAYIAALGVDDHDIGGDERAALTDSMFELAILTNGYTGEELQSVYDKLASGDAKFLRDILDALTGQINLSNDLTEDNRARAKKMNNCLAQLQACCGKKLEIDEHQMIQDASFGGRVKTVFDIYPGVAEALSKNGFEAIETSRSLDNLFKAGGEVDKALELHIERHYAKENYAFCKAVLAFKEIPAEDTGARLEKAREIYDTFVAIKSTQEINIAYDTRSAIINGLEQIEGIQGLEEEQLTEIDTLFDKAYNEIAGLIQSNFLGEFLYDWSNQVREGTARQAES